MNKSLKRKNPNYRKLTKKRVNNGLDVDHYL